ncbi:MAG: amidohydrolase family protein [Alphaproteobacteria bacterium]
MPIDLFENISLIDHHCHGVVRETLDRPRFERLISESHTPPPAGTSYFQKPIGLAVRRYCSPVLDLPALASAEEYCSRRVELGAEEVNRRLMQATGLGMLLVDTGHRSDSITGHEELGEIADVPSREVVRIEAIAEKVAHSGIAADQFADAFANALRSAAKHAVGLKSIIAYRASFNVDQTAPTDNELRIAVSKWLQTIEAEGQARLEDPVILRYVLWTGADLCRERAFPMQLHVGFGDEDIYMHACDPTHFTDFFKAVEPWAFPVTLLHCYPFHREAGWLAEIFPYVYFDVGAILNYTGPSHGDIVGEALELGPFTKQLFSSDAFGLPELYYLGAVYFRRGLNKRLNTWIESGDCLESDAREIARLIGYQNTQRIYQLER